MTPRKSFAVFEIVNERRREIYVGATSDPIFRIISHLRAQKPVSIGEWNLDDAATPRSVEFNMDEADARTFIQNYVKTALAQGWKYLT